MASGSDLSHHLPCFTRGHEDLTRYFPRFSGSTKILLNIPVLPREHDDISLKSHLIGGSAAY